MNNLNTIIEREDGKNETISIKEANESLFYFDNDEIKESNYYKPKIKKIKSNDNNDDYILEKIFLNDYRLENYYNISNQMRNSVNNFNKKIYFFPKLHAQLKDNINANEKKKNNKNKNDNTLPIPYISAIRLLKSLKNYKSPFEKLLLIATINDQIMESATSFWKGMESYIDKDYLFIEADEIMNIFLYIIIQTQMPEILLYCKIIEYFTTQFTRSFSVSYNFTLLEASLQYINELKDVGGLNQKENGFVDASKNIMNISNQRISRLSLGIPQDN